MKTTTIDVINGHDFDRVEFETLPKGQVKKDGDVYDWHPGIGVLIYTDPVTQVVTPYEAYPVS